MDERTDNPALTLCVVVIMATTFLIVSIGTLLSGLLAERTISLAKSWQRTPGRVVACAFEPQQRNGYSADIQVDYLGADGLSYKCTTIHPGDHEYTTYTGGEVREIERDYPVGSAADVYVDPSQPWNSALEIRTSEEVTNDFVSAVVFGLGAVCMFVNGLFQWQLHRPRKAKVASKAPKA